ncbi:MAG: class I fructose-bisphosphate aldolase [Trueperaceae bacterium]|nr:class I fructose-bisphosphate aldolase [Trueperaceae bacterium]
MTDRVREILSNYKSENPGVRTNIARLLNSGNLAGTGRLVILPVDQGFEHGPARSFSDNPEGYDPAYHFQLALDAGCNAYAAPLGFLEAAAADFAAELPLILKLNNHDSMAPDGEDPVPSVTASVDDALRLGCSAIGFTIYPGSAHFKTMYQEIREISAEAKRRGLATVIWAYPRGSSLSEKDETAIDIVSYAAQISAQLGANVIKVKLPTDHIALDKAKKKYEEHNIPVSTVADRVRHVVQSAFNGKRIVIFSGGSKTSEESFYEDIRGIYDGGGFGSIIGRNSFQRPHDDAVRFLGNVMDIYRGKAEEVLA